MQTANKITQLMQDLAKPTKKEKKTLEVKHKRNVSFLEARKIVSTYMAKTAMPLLLRADTIN